MFLFYIKIYSLLSIVLCVCVGGGGGGGSSAVPSGEGNENYYFHIPEKNFITKSLFSFSLRSLLQSNLDFYNI